MTLEQKVDLFTDLVLILAGLNVAMLIIGLFMFAGVSFDRENVRRLLKWLEENGVPVKRVK